MTVIRENYRAERKDWKIHLQLSDSVELEIFVEPDAPKRVNYPEVCGLRHLAFQVVSVEESEKELERAGIICEPIRIDDFPGKKMTFFADPDGLSLEIHE